MTTQTYSQEQLNIVAKSYEQEMCKLLALKADKDLTIFKKQAEINELKAKLAEKDKLISELNSKLSKPEEE